MPDIMVVLACCSQCIEPTTRRHLARVIEAMLSISGRVTMKGLSRWSGKGGSYRTLQRLFTTSLNGCQLNWGTSTIRVMSQMGFLYNGFIIGYWHETYRLMPAEILSRVPKVHLLHYPSEAVKALINLGKSALKLMQESKCEKLIEITSSGAFDHPTWNFTQFVLDPLQELMGHKKKETTLKYIHLAKTNLRQEMVQTAL